MTLPRFVRCACALLFLAATGASHATDRGLALTIGAPRGLPALRGVQQDRDAARAVYSRLGFDGPLRELSDRELPLGGLRAALGLLVRETEPGDRVFLYFSGYGAARAQRGAGCAPSWVAHDGRVLPPAELSRAVQSLDERAGQVVVVVDASAVAGPRGARLPRGAKSAPSAANCAPAGAWLSAASGASSPDGAVPRSGLVILSAARHDEAAFDDPSRGGVATQALLGCLGQPEFNRNPLATFDDLHRCALDRVAALAQHPVLVGNAGLPLQPRLAAMVPPSAELGREAPVAALRRVAANADARWRVSASTAGAPGSRPAAAMSVTSDRDGYLYIVRAGADAADLGLVYPQRADDPNRLRAGQGFDLPRPANESAAAGGDQWMVLVSEQPMRSGDLLVQLGLAYYAAVACLRNIGSDDCPSTAAGTSEPSPALHYGATLLSPDGRTPAAR